MMDLSEAIYTRRSIRHFKKGEKIPEWKLERILDAARWAPSPENQQMQRFIVVRDPETKKMLADVSQEQARSVFGATPYELVSERQWFVPEESRPGIFETVTDGSLFRYPDDCDTVIIGCISAQELDYTEALPFDPTLATFSLSMAVQNMWLTATSLGLGAAFNGLPFADPRRTTKLSEYFGIPRVVTPLMAFCVGTPLYPRVAAPSRFPLESICHSEYWGNRYRRLDYRR